MITLALDTATARASVALGEPGERVPEAVIANRNDLSRSLGSVVSNLCRDRGVEPAGIEAVVVADGPGSFTGLRIGIAFAKGLCAVSGAPLHTAPSLMGAALAASGTGTVVAEYDALRGDVYRAVFAFSVTGSGLEVATVMPPEVVPAPLPPPVREYARADERNASAAALLLLLNVPGGAVRIDDAGTWEPNYGRLAEAEARRRARNAATARS